jgi:hypothetical protein
MKRTRTMKSRTRDLYDSSGVLSSWENEGGARGALPDAERGSRYASDDILHSFGRSVVAHWNDLPHSFKHMVFQEIASKGDRPVPGLPGLKERAARLLHENSSQLLKRERRPAWADRDSPRVSFPERPRSLGDFASGQLGNPPG